MLLFLLVAKPDLFLLVQNYEELEVNVTINSASQEILIPEHGIKEVCLMVYIGLSYFQTYFLMDSSSLVVKHLDPGFKEL